MNLPSLIVSRARLFLTVALLFTAIGAFAWQTMPRQEDPAIPARASLLVIPFPGADASRVERLVIEPLEDRLAQIHEIKRLFVTARAGVAILTIELRDEVSDVEPVWDEVERKLRQTRPDWPDAVGEPHYDRDLFDQESILIAVAGVDDPLVLAHHADALEDRLLALPTVSRVITTGDPGEQILIELDPSAARRLGVDARTLAGVIGARSATIPGGAIEAGGRVVTIEPASEFASLDAIRTTPIPLAAGGIVALEEIATVRRAPVEPVQDLMRYDGQRAVSVGVVPQVGINLLTFGDEVDAVVQAFAEEVSPLTVEYVAFQPRRVEERLQSLGKSLTQGVLIVALVVLLAMGPRLGFTVASIVPIVTLSSLALYAMGGGVLHQMSIAALVLALGLLVDNAIVVAENVQDRLDKGATRRDAAVGAIRELAVPLGAATGTTLAAFIPMYLSVGPTGDFTRALPIVIMLTLSVSYVFAITVTPALSAWALSPRPERATSNHPAARAVAHVAVRYPLLILAGTGALMALVLSMAPQVGMQFFPISDRNQVIVDVELPEGSHVSATSAVADALERTLAERDDVTNVTAWIGRGVPHFYYNLIQKPNRPHLAQMVVTTVGTEDVQPVIDDVRAYAREELPGVSVVARRIEQGPPIEAPIEVRLYGEDLDDLQHAQDAIAAVLRTIDGAVDVRGTLGVGTASVHFEVDDAAALRHGVFRDDVALAILGQTYGLQAGSFRGGDEPVPIRVRAPGGEQTSPDALRGIEVTHPGQRPVPLQQVAHERPSYGPAAIARRNGTRYAAVLAQLAPDATFTDVLGALQPELDALDLPPSVRVEFGGEAEGSGDANAALLHTLPIGIAMLLICLMGEFNSFRRVAIVLVTVPLAAVGVIPGLVLGNQPFGFMSMLGVIALIGIVVNNAIVLIDVIAREADSGAALSEAIATAVVSRVRPILLTTATTVAGMLPLAMSPSTFWPPLASSMISGLLASTVLTLLVVPALYRLLFRDKPRPQGSQGGDQ